MDEHLKGTILLCEDDNVIRDLYRKILELNGYRVIEAVDGDDAVEKFLEHREAIRLMVSDVMMPNKNGTQAYEEIQKNNGRIKVIFNSGFNTETNRRLQEEGFHYLQKPYAPQLLLQKIREVMVEECDSGGIR